MTDINTSNDFFLGSNGDTLSFMLHPTNMDADQALRAAAWLVALVVADFNATHTFAEVLEAVQNT